jgi:RES domain-containing protein
MELYRITQEKYADDLSGNGARLYGGRWNSEGKYALYTAATRSLALLEILAHVPARLLSDKRYILVTLTAPADKTLIEMIRPEDLPGDWDALDVQHVTQTIGDKFLQEQKKLVMTVPSVLVPEEFNYVINPLHAAMKQVKIIHKRELRFNDRLVKSL